jgi:hypothetical protein
MIEIKITIDMAVNLLLERMKYELLIRQQQGSFNTGLKLENLSYHDLFKITEVSVFDTVLLLPVDLIVSESNLVQIITQTVRSLSKNLSREEFQIYSAFQARKLITPVCIYIKNMVKSENFKNN